MSEASVIIIPAVLSTKQCHDYCGGQPVFQELVDAHPEILTPLRVTERGDTYYRRVTVDAALAVAEKSGKLINREGAAKLLIKRKTARRFATCSGGL